MVNEFLMQYSIKSLGIRIISRAIYDIRYQRERIFIVAWRNHVVLDYVSRIDRPRARCLIFLRNTRQPHQITSGSHDHGTLSRHRDISKSRISHETARERSRGSEPPRVSFPPITRSVVFRATRWKSSVDFVEYCQKTELDVCLLYARIKR